MAAESSQETDTGVTVSSADPQAPINELDDDWALTSFDPWDRRLNHDNIWRLYEVIRRETPVGYSEARGGYWLLSRFEDVKRAAVDHASLCSGRGVSIGQAEVSDPPGAPLEYDPPEHTKIRAVMFEPFRGRNAQQFAETVQKHVAAILDAAGRLSSVDLVEDVARQLPVAVISDVIGFDDEARKLNSELSLGVIETSNYDSMYAARTTYIEFLRGQIRKSAANPGKGFLGEITSKSFAGYRFTEREILGIIFAMGLAGHHSTSNALASMLIRAADGSAREKWLPDLDDSHAVNAFIEEVLRIEPPIHLEGRRAVVPVRVGNVEIPAGDQVALLYGSANHDERRFPDPKRFSPGRGAGHLSFGSGIHVCLGMNLARMEMATLLRELLCRFPDYELSDPPLSSGMVFGHHMGWRSIPAVLA
jgi:cytochrome P450